MYVLIKCALKRHIVSVIFPPKIINLNSSHEEITNKSKLKDIPKVNRCLFYKLSRSRKIKMGEELFEIKETQEI